jgi:hypothetical protein
MKYLKIFYLLLQITSFIKLSKLETCILTKINESLSSNTKLKKIKTTLLSAGNLNQKLLLQKLITNFDLLPQDLKNALQGCENNTSPLLNKCEKFYGEGNCEQINKFTVVQKCPVNYIRDDHTRCVRSCAADSIVIDYNCERHQVYYIKEIKKFASLEDCLKENKNCAKDTDDSDVFIEDCQLNYKKISFMCIPYCFNEITQNLKAKILQDSRYCIKDYISTGMPFYDI